MDQNTNYRIANSETQCKFHLNGNVTKTNWRNDLDISLWRDAYRNVLEPTSVGCDN